MKLLIVILLATLTFSIKHRHALRQCPCDASGCPSCMLGNALKKAHEDAEEIVNITNWSYYYLEFRRRGTIE